MRKEHICGVVFVTVVLTATTAFSQASATGTFDISVLNATGDCYQRLGRADNAREMFELSPSVNPNQEGVRIRLSELQVQ